MAFPLTFTDISQAIGQGARRLAWNSRAVHMEPESGQTYIFHRNSSSNKPAVTRINRSTEAVISTDTYGGTEAELTSVALCSGAVFDGSKFWLAVMDSGSNTVPIYSYTVSSHTWTREGTITLSGDQGNQCQGGLLLRRTAGTTGKEFVLFWTDGHKLKGTNYQRLYFVDFDSSLSTNSATEVSNETGNQIDHGFGGQGFTADQTLHGGLEADGATIFICAKSTDNGSVAQWRATTITNENSLTHGAGGTITVYNSPSGAVIQDSTGEDWVGLFAVDRTTEVIRTRAIGDTNLNSANTTNKSLESGNETMENAFVMRGKDTEKFTLVLTEIDTGTAPDTIYLYLVTFDPNTSAWGTAVELENVQNAATDGLSPGLVFGDYYATDDMLGLIRYNAGATSHEYNEYSLASGTTYEDATTETLTLADAVATTVSKESAVTEALGLMDAVSTLATAEGAFTETLVLADAVDTNIVAEDDTSETLVLTDTAVGVIVVDVSFTEALVLADTAEYAIFIPGNVTEALVLADTATAIAVAEGQVIEALVFADAVDTIIVAEDDFTESLVLADAATAIAIAESNVTEALVFADAVATIVSKESSIAEALTLTDSTTGTIVVDSSFSEALVLADAATAIAVAEGQFTESITFADTAIGGLIVGSSFIEALVLADTVATTVSKESSVAEALVLADTASAIASAESQVTEALVLADAVTGVIIVEKSIAEALVLADSASSLLVALTTITETIVLVDTVVSDVSSGTVEVAVVEALTLADVATPSAVAEGTFTETLVLADAAASVIVVESSVTEALVLADVASIMLIVERGIVESLTLADVATAVTIVTGVIAESLSLADSTSVIVAAEGSVVEVITIGDTMSGLASFVNAGPYRVVAADVYTAGEIKAQAFRAGETAGQEVLHDPA